jgi:hypothetical protein
MKSPIYFCIGGIFESINLTNVTLKVSYILTVSVTPAVVQWWYHKLWPFCSDERVLTGVVLLQKVGYGCVGFSPVGFVSTGTWGDARILTDRAQGQGQESPVLPPQYQQSGRWSDQCVCPEPATQHSRHA